MNCNWNCNWNSELKFTWTWTEIISRTEISLVPSLFDDLCQSCKFFEFAELYFSVSSSANDSVLGNSDICSLLSAWAIEYSVSHKSLSVLLWILSPHFPELHKDPASLYTAILSRWCACHQTCYLCWNYDWYPDLGFSSRTQLITLIGPFRFKDLV